jgi:S-adenosylmethionine-diacylglycerol 3-amino-3-carboxypropyl transferase
LITDASVPAWVIEAAGMPIAFAQVREDPLLDLAILERVGTHRLRVMMIASGGCTAAYLAACGRVSHLHLVDANPAQIALSRVKLRLLESAEPGERMRLMGHADFPAAERAARLEGAFAEMGLPRDVLGPTAMVGECGPDHVGRYELLFARLREELREHSTEIEELLTVGDAAERASRIATTSPLGRALDDAFDRVMALPNLVRLFGADATRNSRQPFSRHFAQRTRVAIESLPTVGNPYLWQLLLGRFPKGVCYPWLDVPRPERIPDITHAIGTMDATLAAAAGSYDFVHLSNILDWLSPDDARRTLELAGRALVPGGYVFVRQLNSTLDVPSSGPAFEWLHDVANELHARDRSFFYRALHVGRRR